MRTLNSTEMNAVSGGWNLPTIIWVGTAVVHFLDSLFEADESTAEAANGAKVTCKGGTRATANATTATCGGG